MGQIWILAISIVLQAMAAVTALQLIRRTRWWLPWSLLAVALGLMALRRSLTLVRVLQQGSPEAMDLSAELVALTISALMVIGMLLLRPEFTIQKRTEDSLRESDATYRGILDNMLETFFRIDLEGHFQIVSQAVVEMLGYSATDLVGTRVTDLLVDTQRWQDLQEALEDGRGSVREFRANLRHKDGRILVIECNASYLHDENGSILGVDGVARDITQRIRQEHLTSRLGRIIEDSRNEIYVFDSETLRFQLVNRGARENLGLTMEELAEITPFDIKPEFDEASFRHAIRPLYTGEISVSDFETEHQRKDGSRYSVEVHLQLARSEDPPIFFAIIRDITTKKKTELALAQAQKMEAMGQLTGGVAHDFNNLLTVILGNQELTAAELEEAGLSSAHLDEAHAGALRAAVLTQRLLAFSRKQPLRPAVTDLRAVVQGMDGLLARTLRADIQLETIGTARLWRCETDPSQLENLILNLAINARDAMPNGGKLTIETSNAVLDEVFALRHPGVQQGQYVMLAISDTGVGMTEEVRSKAFSPFFTTKSRGSGTGLGLSMVYGFVKQSGGYIDIYSEEGEGTTVKVYLPRCTKSEEESSGDTAPVDDVPRGQGQSILVVEDDAEVRKLTLDLLRQLGYHTLEASDGVSALETLSNGAEVQLLLADIVLPGGMNGADLGRQAEALYPDLKVLYMSGYTENAIIHNGRLDTGVELLEKPFTKGQLARKIKRALREKPLPDASP